VLCEVVIEVGALPFGDALLRHQGFQDIRLSRVRTASSLTVLSAATEMSADEDVCSQFSPLTVEQPNQGLSVPERVVDRMMIVLWFGEDASIFACCENRRRALRRNLRSVARSAQTGSCRSSARNRS
jgi:hypothetical protein